MILIATLIIIFGGFALLLKKILKSDDNIDLNISLKRGEMNVIKRKPATFRTRVSRKRVRT